MIRWNEEYKVYVSDEGRVWNKANKELLFEDIRGYKRLSRHFKCGSKHIFVHRLVWITFMGPIPDNLQIDHFNRIKDDNRLSNLRVVTPSENQYNRGGYCRSEFGQKFINHYGKCSKEAKELYIKEYHYWRYHGKCSWE